MRLPGARRALRGYGARRDPRGGALAHPPHRVLRAGYFRQGDALRYGRSDRGGADADGAPLDRRPAGRDVRRARALRLRALPQDEGRRALHDDQGALFAHRARLLLPVDDPAAGQLPRLRLQQLRQGAGGDRAGRAGGHEPVGIQAPLRRALQRQRLPLDDASEGDEDILGHPRRRGQHQGADGQIRLQALHAVQPLLQELPPGDARPAHRVDQGGIACAGAYLL